MLRPFELKLTFIQKDRSENVISVTHMLLSQIFWFPNDIIINLISKL